MNAQRGNGSRQVGKYTTTHNGAYAKALAERSGRREQRKKNKKKNRNIHTTRTRDLRTQFLVFIKKFSFVILKAIFH